VILWEDVNARVSGLGSRLLPPAAYARLAQTQNLQTLSRALAELGALPNEVPGATAPALELALRRAAGAALAVARRWLGSRAEVVAITLDAEDRRSLRALIRGAAAGVRAEARLAGLVPTPILPERLLRELADRSRVPDQAALLLAAGHPYGAAILAATTAAEPDLFSVELAIARTFAEGAVRGARGDGRFLREYVGHFIDTENCRALLLSRRREVERVPAFLPGGHRLGESELLVASRATRPVDVARALGEAMGGGTVAAILLRHADAPAALEEALEAERGDRLLRESRLDPLGPAPLLLYCHRVRRQAVALSDLVWRLDLNAPMTDGQAA
jgi:vacuolar-type H+-ATPase subunit C/Vma6